MTTLVHTEFSSYEIDQASSLIRRLGSSHEPTRNQGEDGVWKPYWHLSKHQDRMLIEWGIDSTEEGQILRRTLTSTIEKIDGDPLHLTAYSAGTTS